MSSPDVKRMYVPASGLEDWQNLLGDPTKHWKEGRSAMSLALRWCSGDFPPAVRTALDGSGIEAFTDLELIIGLPEHQVPLPPAGAHPSQTDLFVLARSRGEVIAITVEGKVDEPFGEAVETWLGPPSERSGKPERLRSILDLLGIDDQTASGLRYQLLHRTAAALLEAKRFGTQHALMLVHSFDPADAGFRDFESFAHALGAASNDKAIWSVPHLDSPPLYVGWVRDQPPESAN